MSAQTYKQNLSRSQSIGQYGTYSSRGTSIPERTPGCPVERGDPALQIVGGEGLHYRSAPHSSYLN